MLKLAERCSTGKICAMPLVRGRMRRARKEHRCTLCGETIARGDQHAYQRITPWGHPVNEDFFDYRAHRDCDRIWLAVAAEYDNELPAERDEQRRRGAALELVCNWFISGGPEQVRVA